MIPGCGKPGTRLHSHEVAGSDCLLCDGHFKLLFEGAASENDLDLYNQTYNAVLDKRRRKAAEKVKLFPGVSGGALNVPPAEDDGKPLPGEGREP
jgi:hypothetical protein